MFPVNADGNVAPGWISSVFLLQFSADHLLGVVVVSVSTDTVLMALFHTWLVGVTWTQTPDTEV